MKSLIILEQMFLKNYLIQGLCLPSDTKMTKDQQQRVIDVIRSLFK